MTMKEANKATKYHRWHELHKLIKPLTPSTNCNFKAFLSADFKLQTANFSIEQSLQCMQQCKINKILNNELLDF